MEVSRKLEERWLECACAPGDHQFVPVGGGFLECRHCLRIVPRAGLNCDVCGSPAVMLVTRPGGRRRHQGSSSSLCGSCFDDFAVHGINTGWRGRSRY